VVNSEHVDVIHTDQLTMTQFAFPLNLQEGKKPALIFDAHNAVWTITKRMKENAPFYMKTPLWLETKRIKRYEGMIVSDFQATLAVTEPDRLSLMDAVHEYGGNCNNVTPISVIPIAVDTDQIRPIPREAESLNILTMGTLYYPPNADGIRWFVQDVFPLVRQKLPKVTLTIVGKNPPKDFVRLAEDSQSGVTVTGFVEELEPYFAKSALMVIPVRAGGGMRVRILEAFARAMPVVTTTIGLEGIQAEPGRDVLVADDPADFAQSVIDLLQDKMLQDELSTNGRRLVENKYDWQVVLGELDKTYERLAQTSS
jgi:glycosyltransferase involved in cell wall biosynthesis